jgi:putative ATP-dependent endonuclease of the OLD family
MKLSSLRLQNFRCFLDQTIDLDDYTCLVGPGGAGKSTILTALRIFFRDPTASPTDLLILQEEDFHHKDTSKDVVITATFSDLDSEAQEDFKHYFRQGQLVISAIAKWNTQTRSAEIKQYGQRLGMSAFSEFFKAEGDKASVADLKIIYAKIQTAVQGLPAAGTKPTMQSALAAYESRHPELCELLLSADEFYGATKGVGRLDKYVQWVFVPAVKDASTEGLESKKTALGQLLERTVRTKISFSERLAELRHEIETKYQTLLEGNQNALEALSKSLSMKLQEWAHPEAKLTLAWRDDSSTAISIREPLAEVLAAEGKFTGALSRFGHGLQRSFLLALLQELAGCGGTGNPRLLLACEEPELHQHPPQARHLSSVLQKLSRTNSQVIVSSHSPYFISGRGFPDVRVVRQELAEDQPCIRSAGLAELSQKLAQALEEARPITTGAMELKVEQALQPSLNEMFFSPVLILVEGQEDLAYISTYMTLTDRVEDFRRLGCHIVTTSGKGGMIQPLALARILEIPTFVMFDADGDSEGGERTDHERQNLALLRLCSITAPNPFPSAIFHTASLVMWPTKIGAEIERDLGKDEWDKYKAVVREKRKISGLPNLTKNVLFIGYALTEAHEDGKKSGVLEGVCSHIISFAESVRANTPRQTAAFSDPS